MGNGAEKQIRTLAVVALSVLALALLVACGEEEAPPYFCGHCVDEPEAIPADDDRSTGVYKGVITSEGHSGTLHVEIATDESTGWAQAIVNGEALDADEFSIDDLGGDTVYTFSGSSFTLVLVISPSGEIISVEFTYGGETIPADVAKELSDLLVRCFEGAWGGTGPTGVWNFLVVGNDVLGTYGGFDSGEYYGELSGTNATIWSLDDSPSDDPLATGSISGDSAGGSWSRYGYSGSWWGARTL